MEGPSPPGDDAAHLVDAPARPSRHVHLMIVVAVPLLVLGYGLARGWSRHRASPLPWGADAASYCRIAKSIVERGTVELPPPDRLERDPQIHLDVAWGTPYALTIGRRVLPKHSIAFALLLVPGYALGGTFGAFAAALLLAAALAGFVTARCARRLGALPAALATAVLFFFVPTARTVAFGINIDVALTLAMVLALAAATDGRAASAGAIAGFALFLRPTAPLLLWPVPLLLARSRDRRTWWRLAAGLAPPLVLWLAANTFLWGAPWRTSYERALVFDGAGWHLAAHSSEFGGDVLHGLALLLVDPAGGVLLTAPVMLLGALGFLDERTRQGEWPLAVLASALALASLASYRFLAVIPAYNTRFAFPLLVSLVPPLAACLRWTAAGLRKSA